MVQLGSALNVNGLGMFAALGGATVLAAGTTAVAIVEAAAHEGHKLPVPATRLHTAPRKKTKPRRLSATTHAAHHAAVAGIGCVSPASLAELSMLRKRRRVLFAMHCHSSPLWARSGTSEFTCNAVSRGSRKHNASVQCSRGSHVARIQSPLHEPISCPAACIAQRAPCLCCRQTVPTPLPNPADHDQGTDPP